MLERSMCVIYEVDPNKRWLTNIEIATSLELRSRCLAIPYTHQRYRSPQLEKRFPQWRLLPIKSHAILMVLQH
jgi:hypothetical protein